MGKKKIREEPWVKIHNVVASVKLRHGIDVEAVYKAFPDTEYKPAIFPGLVFRLNRPKTATLIFSSGKMVCTGAKSEKGATRAIKKIIRMLKDRNIVIMGRPKIEIQNIVASANLGGEIDLYGFYLNCGREMGGGIMYEPEQFPGLIYRMEEPKAVILIFGSGKLVCTGTKREVDVYRAIHKIIQKLETYEAIAYARSKERVAKALEMLKHEQLPPTI